MTGSKTILVMFGAAIVLMLALLNRASAAPPYIPTNTYHVTTTQDQSPSPPTGSLRWAIQQANQNSNPDIIDFEIGSGGAKTILLVRELPEITTPVTIDGTTQNNYNGTPLIEINGAGAIQGSGEVSGFTIRSGGNGSTIRGLNINSFRGNGIELLDSNNVTIENNYIGTDLSGSSAFANGKEGVLIGNETGTASNNTVRNNIISGNTGSGIHISGLDATNNVIRGNKIGTDAAGTADLGNLGFGVRIENAVNNTIGGTGANEGNIIAFNGDSGVILELRDGNTVRRNSIFSNGGLGIEVTGFSQENAPLISPNGTPPTSSATVTFTGDPNTQYVFEFFENQTCDASDYGEGETYFLQQTANSDGSGLVSFQVSLTGSNITATATGGLGTALNPFFTTQFSPCYTGSPFETRTPTPTATATLTGTPTNTRTATMTFTPVTFTATPTHTPTKTPSPSNTPTSTRTPSGTPSPVTPTNTRTPSPTNCAGKPGIPTNVSPGNGSTVFVRNVPLAWNSVSCATFYKVVVKQGSKTGPRIQKKKVTTAQFTTKDLAKGEDYVWHAKACKPGKKNCSKWSPWWKFKVSNSATYQYQRDFWFLAELIGLEPVAISKN